ncbi:MAG: ureidoglycolate lyase [Pleomorphochaeta sp.]
MRKIKAQKLTTESFKEFGSFYNMVDPQGYNLGDFFPDHLDVANTTNMSYGFSSLNVYKKDKMLVDTVEYHNYSAEVLLPIDTDIVIHVAPPNNKNVVELTQAFIIPKGTIVKLNIGVTHLCPFSITEEEGHVMVALPQRTYQNDCVLVDLSSEDQFEIVL